jgi:hypothetical protein
MTLGMTAHFVDAGKIPGADQFSVRAAAEGHIVVLDKLGECFDLSAMHFLVVGIQNTTVRPGRGISM